MYPTAALRAFGRIEDLELEFASADRPALVTALLARCGEASDPAFWWSQPVGARIAALARVLASSGEGEALAVPLRCPRQSCSAPFEVELAFAVLAADGITAEPIAVTLADGRSVALRRPTGRDLRDWRRTQWASRQEAVTAMLAVLCVDGEAVPEDEAAIADVLEARDPLVAFAVSCACPSCGAENDLPVDIEGIALAKLAARQRALLREIHALASTYGWTEREILAIAPERRARYLGLIEDPR
jgi:hypothetical protein